MNYGEEWAYWYLRLNGFFPLNNFVVHKDGDSDYRGDVDLLGLRMPHVFEEIGGQDDDWDPLLRDRFDLTPPLVWICEVKTGAVRDLFRPEGVDRAVKRAGLVPMAEANAIVGQLHESAIVSTQWGTFAKVLISAREHLGDGYLNITRGHVNAFVESRVRRHAHEKFASRMFFPSNLFQEITHRVHEDMFGLGGDGPDAAAVDA